MTNKEMVLKKISSDDYSILAEAIVGSFGLMREFSPSYCEMKDDGECTKPCECTDCIKSWLKEEAK